MGTPFFILARGQSNVFIRRPYDWSPNPRIRVWNNLVGIDTSVGNAWAPASNSEISLAVAYADFVAEYDPSLDPYVCVLANGSLDIGHFTAGNTYVWEAGTTAPPSLGALRGNHATPASITQLFLSETDSTGAGKRTFPNRINNTTRLKLYNDAGTLVAEFTCNGTPVDSGTYWTIPVGSAVIHGAIAGTITLAASPDFYRGSKLTVPAALAAVPGGDKTTIDMELRWQGESDPETGETRYKQQWNEMQTLSLAETWYPSSTKLIVFGISEIWSHATSMNQWLKDLVAADATNRRYVDLPKKVGYSFWTDGEVHMTPEGYIAAAADAAQVYLPGSTYWWNEFKVAGSAGAFSPVADRVLKYGNGGTFVAPARTYIKDNAGRFIRPGRMTKNIASISTTSPLSTILDVTSDPRHVTSPSGRSVGLWLDGPPVVHRNHVGAGVVYLGAHSTYRFAPLAGDWTGASGFSNVPYAPVKESNHTGVELEYDHRIWLFGVYKPRGSQIVYGIAHHEWYPYRVTVDGIPGYNQTLGHKWVTSPLWLKSTDNGLTWSTKPVTAGADNQHRLYLKPEPWGLHSHDILYGFRHPSNIVRPSDAGFVDGYYYALLDACCVGQNEDTLLSSGVAMIRWSDPEDPTTTEFWDGKRWVPRDLASYQGNEGQKPYLFFQRGRYDVYGGQGASNRMGQVLRYHVPSGLWVMFGYTGEQAGYLCYAVTPSLAEPEWELRGRRMISLAGGGTPPEYIGNTYINVFDPSYVGQDLNYTLMGNNPILMASQDLRRLQRQTLAISV